MHAAVQVGVNGDLLVSQRRRGAIAKLPRGGLQRVARRRQQLACVHAAALHVARRHLKRVLILGHDVAVRGAVRGGEARRRALQHCCDVPGAV